MYKLCIIGLSIIFTLSINGVLSQILCGRFEGSWVFTTDPALQHRNFGIGKVFDEPEDELGYTVKIAGTPITPIQAVWYPELRHRGRNGSFPYSHYFVLKLHQFEGNELSLVDTLVKAKNKKQVGMLLCKKFDGECGQNYDGQVSYVEDGDEIGIYIIPESYAMLEVYYFINNVKVGNPEKLQMRSFNTLFPAVTFTKPGVVTMMECREEPPEKILIDIEFKAGRHPIIEFNALMDYYNSKEPNDSELFDYNKYEKKWTFSDDFIVCKNHEDQAKVPKLAVSKENKISLNVLISRRTEKGLRFDFTFHAVNTFMTVIKRDLVNNIWSKFAPVTSTRMFVPADIRALETWLVNFLSSANIVFLGPKGRSLHIADDKCALNLKYKI